MSEWVVIMNNEDGEPWAVRVHSRREGELFTAVANDITKDAYEFHLHAYTPTETISPLRAIRAIQETIRLDEEEEAQSQRGLEIARRRMEER